MSGKVDTFRPPVAPDFTFAAQKTVDGSSSQESPRSRFFASSGSSSDVTPEHSPVKQGNPTTPSPVKAVTDMLKDLTPDRSLNSKEKKRVQRGLTFVDDAASPERQNLTGKLLQAFERGALPRLGRLNFSDPDDPSIIAIPHLDDLIDTWVIEFLGQLKEHAHTDKIPFPILLNEDHVTSPSKSGKKDVGFHFCPVNHPLAEKVKKICENGFTNVWCGTWDGGAGPKFSTFFPRHIETLEHLLWLLAQGRPCINQDNKAILQIPATKTPHRDWEPLEYPLYVEVYQRAQGTIYWSAFPIFYFARYVEETVFNITTTYKISSKELLERTTFAVSKDPRLISYDADSHYYIDVAPLLPDCGVPKGILIGFPKVLFKTDTKG